MNKYVQENNVKGSRELKPKITRNVLSNKKTKELDIKTSSWLPKPK